MPPPNEFLKFRIKYSISRSEKNANTFCLPFREILLGVYLEEYFYFSPSKQHFAFPHFEPHTSIFDAAIFNVSALYTKTIIQD